MEKGCSHFLELGKDIAKSQKGKVVRFMAIIENEKVYVTVNADYTHEGIVIPRAIIRKDGRVQEIEDITGAFPLSTSAKHVQSEPGRMPHISRQLFGNFLYFDMTGHCKI